MTPDTWHLTCDTWWGVNILSKFQLPSSFGLGGEVIWRSGGKGSLNQSMNDEAVYRTAPATPGLLNIFKALWIPNHKSWGAEILRECSPPSTCHMSGVRCHVSYVRCHVSGVTCQVSCVTFFYFFVWQSGEASRWRVCYQRGLPRLVYITFGIQNVYFITGKAISI